MSSSHTEASLSAAAVLYSRTRDYRRTLEALPSDAVPYLVEWTTAVRGALSGLEDAVARSVIHHEMWPWIDSRVQANPVIAGRLLARLNPDRAASPSSFWRFCGLATVVANVLQCNRCRRIVHHATALSTSCSRPTGREKLQCGGAFHLVTSAAPVRIAQRWTNPAKGGRQPYDAEARTAAYLLGHDLIQRSVIYGSEYRRELLRLSVARSMWAERHRHRAARRRVTKAFLADLWQEWRSKRGLSTQSGAR